MAQTADLTVAIATLDRPEGLARALDALLGGHVLPAEILIIDQGQTQLTQEVIAQRQQRQVSLHHYPQKKHGLSAARNASFRLASYPIVAVSDDDCVADARWVKAIASEFASAHPPDAVTGRVLPLGPEVAGLYAVSSRVSNQPMD